MCLSQELLSCQALLPRVCTEPARAGRCTQHVSADSCQHQLCV